MKFVDEFRDAKLAQELLEQIRNKATRKWTLMEVCGGQTHGLLQYGIPDMLSSCIELIHGPGCPVCVTPQESIDLVQQLARRPGFLVTSFGDMLRVPGTSQSLLDIRSQGGNVKPVYSPVDAVQLAVASPQTQVVFFAVGFETTVPATALAILQAAELGLTNFSMVVSHVRVQPAMESIVSSPHNRVQAFLAAGHVCAVTGFHSYSELADTFGVPVAVTGFEPVDLLDGILECVSQLETDRHEAVNCYSRAVRETGNSNAQELIDRAYEVVDSRWRGLSVVPGGGYRIRSQFSDFDATLRFGHQTTQHSESDAPESRCQAGEVLIGQLKPCDCPEFAVGCTPDSPLGAPMVSSEGACAAWYRYRRDGVSVGNSTQTDPR